MVHFELRVVVERVCRVKYLSNLQGRYSEWSHLQNLYLIMRNAHQSDFIRKIAETLVTRLLLVALGLVTGVIIARVLGPAGRGQYATAVVISGLGVQFGNLGLHASNTYYVSQDRQLFSSAFVNSLIVGAVLGGGIAFLLWILLSIRPVLFPSQGLLLLLALIWIPVGLVNLLLQNLQIGVQEIRHYNIIMLSTKILSVALLSALIFFEQVKVESVFAVSVLVGIVSTIWTIWTLRTFLKGPIKPSINLFEQGLRYGFKAYLAALFSYLVLRFDLLMVKQMLGEEQAGYYSTAANMADMLYMLPVTVGTVLFPKLSAMADKGKMQRYTKNVALILAGLMCILTFGASLVVHPAINLLYGEAFLPSVTPFIWLMPAIVFLSVNTIFQNYFAAQGMPLITIYSSGAAALLNVILNQMLIPDYGILGASFASSVSYGLMLITSLVYIYLSNNNIHEQN